MMYSLGTRSIELRGKGQWIAPNATLIGDIVLEENVSIWWGAILRADGDRITIGAGSNIQDGAILHVDPGFPLTVGENVTVGHRAMLHGCTVGEGSLIGIGATILNGARIGKSCVVGAQALIGEGKDIPERSLVVGVPGKIARKINDEQVARLQAAAMEYVARARQYQAELQQQK